MRYIERLKKFDTDYGDADILSENDDVVRIMSIHKSKGLEFPVVFVSDISKKFHGNRGDTVIFSPKLGIGLDCIDGENRLKFDSFFKNAIKTENEILDKGEELRILYVAFTRAKEKLILTGAFEDPESELLKTPEMSYLTRLNARRYSDWILPPSLLNRGLCNIVIKTPEDGIVKNVFDFALRENKKRELIRLLTKDNNRSGIGEMFFTYPYDRDDRYKIKYSVSEIKKRKMEDIIRDREYPAEEFIKTEKKFERTIPKFLSGEASKENTGAMRGTAMHRFMECFDFTRDDYKSALSDERDRMLSEGRLKEEQAELLNERSLFIFLNSSMAERMHRAAKENRLYKERAFVFGEEAKKLFSDGDKTMLLVQGIIDAFFIEEDGIILLDYKTDRVKTGKELLNLYEKQLIIYADALQKAYDMKVKESCLYSFCLDECVFLV